MAIKLISPEFRVSYAKVWQPGTDDNGNDVYSISMIFSKDTLSDDDLKKIKKCINDAAAEKWGTDTSKWPRQLKICLRDADQEDRSNPSAANYDPAYVNAYFMNAKTYTQPGVVDSNVNPIMDQNEFYSGCYARASLTFKAYDKGGGRGVGCYLNNIMKIRDGERLGGAAPATADFAEFVNDSTGAASDDDIPF
jgi:hypothetical protein